MRVNQIALPGMSGLEVFFYAKKMTQVYLNDEFKIVFLPY